MTNSPQYSIHNDAAQIASKLATGGLYHDQEVPALPLTCPSCRGQLDDEDRESNECPHCYEDLDLDLGPELDFAENILGIDTAKVHTIWLTVGGPTEYIEITEKSGDLVSAELFSSYSGKMENEPFYGDALDSVLDYFSYLVCE